MVNKRAVLLLLGFGMLLFSIAGAINPNGKPLIAPNPQGQGANVNNNNTVQTALSQEEISGLQWMVQEEKLARDVYNSLYQKWGDQIFSNIARSEQTHMNAVANLIDKYNISNPISNLGPGQFQDEALQTVYNQLISEGNKSLLDALKVGAKIEEMDIKDLQERIAQTNHTDIRMVYENLMKGSRNHLRMFYARILDMNGTYEPQYLNETEFYSIVNSSRETGPIVDSQGSIIEHKNGNMNNTNGHKGEMNGNGTGYRKNNTTVEVHKYKNQMMIRVGNETVNCPVCENATQVQNRLMVKLKSGKEVEIKVQPIKAKEEVMRRLGVSNCQNCQVELTTEPVNGQEKVVYKVKAEKTYRLLGIFNIPAEVTASVDPETGDVIGLQQPWWSFLAF